VTYSLIFNTTIAKTRLISFGQFAQLAGRRNLSAKALADRLRGPIGQSLQFFSYILAGGVRHSIAAYSVSHWSFTQWFALSFSSTPPSSRAA